MPPPPPKAVASINLFGLAPERKDMSMRTIWYSNEDDLFDARRDALAQAWRIVGEHGSKKPNVEHKPRP